MRKPASCKASSNQMRSGIFGSEFTKGNKGNEGLTTFKGDTGEQFGSTQFLRDFLNLSSLRYLLLSSLGIPAQTSVVDEPLTQIIA